MPSRVLGDALSVADLRDAYAATMETQDLDYYEGGAEDEVALKRNTASLAAARLWPRVLVGGGERSCKVELLGRQYSSPIGIAPVAMQRLAHDEGECAAAAACAARGALYVMAQQSTTRVEDIAAAADAVTARAPRWLQCYVDKDREVTLALAARARSCGCDALVVTVDSPVLGRRERDQRNRFVLRKGLSLANNPKSYDAAAASKDSGDAQAALAKRVGGRDGNLAWESIPDIAERSGLPVVLKGVVSHADAARAAATPGVAAVWVSNHGGRQLDASPGTFEALPEVVAGVSGRIPVFFDGGVRRGSDVLKALSLGAAFVFVGRPLVWALAAGGREGVERLLAMLDAELQSSMALTGAPTIAHVGRHLVQLAGESPPRGPAQPHAFYGNLGRGGASSKL